MIAISQGLNDGINQILYRGERQIELLFIGDVDIIDFANIV